MAEASKLADIDADIVKVRANLRDLIEQETARSGAQDDDHDDALISMQEAALARLLSARAAVTRQTNLSISDSY